MEYGLLPSSLEGVEIMTCIDFMDFHNTPVSKEEKWS
jgi:hypothetical protein